MTDFLSRAPVFDQDGFIGRETDLRWVGDMLARANPQNCNIIGEPRIGKTSFLYQIKAQKRGIQAEKKSLYIWLRLAELPDLTAEKFWQLLFLRLLAAHQAGDNDDLYIEEMREDPRDLYDELEMMVEELINDHHYERLFILIDDFDLLERSLKSRDLDWLRALATRYAENIAFVISSNESLVSLSEKILTREAIDTPVSPFANMFHNRSLGLLAKPAAVTLCQDTAVAEAQPPFSKKEIDYLLAEAGRHPALLKIAITYYLEAKIYANDTDIFEDVRGDVRLDEQVGWLCRQLWQRRTAAEQAALRAAAACEFEVTDPILQNRLKKHLGLIESRDGRDKLFSDAFAYWVGREMKQEIEPERNSHTGPLPELAFFPEQRLVYQDEREVRLTPLENRLLIYFIENKNQVCTIDDLLENVWGAGKTRSVVEKAVNRLRLKVEHDPKRPRFILSARGEGYIFRYE